MNDANCNNRLYNYIDPLDCDCLDDSEEEEYNRMLRLVTGTANNGNVRSRGPQKIVKDVGVQTTPKIDDIYIPWLLEAERKTEDFYVQLSNLVNTLYHSQKIVFNTKSRLSPPSGISIIKNAHSEKSHRPNVNPKHSGNAKVPDGKSEDPECALVLQLIQDRIQSIRKSAMELKSSIPKVGSEKLEDIGEQEYQIVKSKTVRETNILKLQRSKSLVPKTGSLQPRDFKIKRGDILSTVTESKYVEKRQICKESKQLSHGAGKSDNVYSVPKTKNVGNTKNTASGGSRQASNIRAKQISPQDTKVSPKDNGAPSQASNTQTKQICSQDTRVPTKATGAIPKARERQNVTNASSTIRTQKAKKTNIKPLWK